jgi:hypothetical protein
MLKAYAFFKLSQRLKACSRWNKIELRSKSRWNLKGDETRLWETVEARCATSNKGWYEVTVKRLETKIGTKGTLIRSSRSLKKKIGAEVKEESRKWN